MLYKRSETGLRQAHEITFFLNRLEEELRNSHYTTSHPFTGTADQLSFPAVKTEYEEDASSLVYVLIEYSVKSRYIKKQTTFLSQRRDALEEKDILAPHLERCEFLYPFYDTETETLEWQDKWDGELFQGLPRAVKVRCSVRMSSSDEQTKDIRQFERVLSIPDGVWGDPDA